MQCNNCRFEAQLKVIAVLETIISASFLGLNFKILIQLMLDNVEERELSNRNSKVLLSESALVVYFLIRIIYLFGEVLLAIYMMWNVFKRNIDGLIFWFFMTIIFSIPSRCYFIGGVLWSQYFVATLLIFSINLSFTTYSLVIICLHVKHLTSSRLAGSTSSNSSRRGSNEVADKLLFVL